MGSSKYSIKVTTKAKQAKVIQLDENILKVYVTTAPEKGKANDAVVNLLATHFDIPKNHITIVSGYKNSQKTILITT